MSPNAHSLRRWYGCRAVIENVEGFSRGYEQRKWERFRLRLWVCGVSALLLVITACPRAAAQVVFVNLTIYNSNLQPQTTFPMGLQPIGGSFAANNVPPGSYFDVVIERPDGSIVWDLDTLYPAAASQCIPAVYACSASWGAWPINLNVAGTWQMVLTINGAVVGDAPFTVQNACQVNLLEPPLPYFQYETPWNSQIYDSDSTTTYWEQCALHSGGRPTIQCFGCMLTALSMALYQVGQVTDPSGAPYDPGRLNDFMKYHPGDFDGDNVIPKTTTSDISSVTGKKLKFNEDYFRSSSPDDLIQAVCSANPGGPVPVIVGVNNWGHYVLVTGVQPNSDGSTTFPIIDPGNSANQSLDAYNNNFEIRGFVEDPGGDASGLNVSVNNDADLLVTDPTGRQTGLDGASGIILKNIPQSNYVTDVVGSAEVVVDTAPRIAHSVDMLQPAQGTYVVQVEGSQPGTYSLVVAAFSQDGTAQPRPTISGIAGAGSSSSFQINLTSSPGGISQVVQMASFQTTLADISNSLALGLIKNSAVAKVLSGIIDATSDAAAHGNKLLEKILLNGFRDTVNLLASKRGGQLITGLAPEVLLGDANSLLSQLR